MQPKTQMMNEEKDHEGIVEAPNAQSEKTRCGAPDGPRPKRRGSYDGRQPLPYAGHEATAEFLATPTSLREFNSVTALAKHFNVTRKTVHCCMKDNDVLQRTGWLSIRNKISSDVAIRRAWEEIAEKLIEMALTGNIAAIKLYVDYAWGKDQRSEESRLSSMSLRELILENDDECVPPTHVLRRIKQEEEAEEARLKAAETNRVVEESKDSPK